MIRKFVQWLGLDLLTHEPDTDDGADLHLPAPAPTLEQLPAFVRAHQLGKLARRSDVATHQPGNVAHEGDYDADTKLVDDLADAEVVLSLVPESAPKFPGHTKHRPVLDIDFPVAVLPSTTPGHHHLYIDKELTWLQYRRLLETLRDVGIIEPGYFEASDARGFTAVRLPWIRKAAK